MLKSGNLNQQAPPDASYINLQVLQFCFIYKSFPLSLNCEFLLHFQIMDKADSQGIKNTDDLRNYYKSQDNSR